ncbi:ABC transporter six-transmembrane domain-containing protein [Massilia mucilaginosa]|uniref:ABC transporter six-transmembrane domain-containing protein n=1 Tax=Massilia mucilaginosa TaxID=2609282 RepID=UPI00351D5625
MRRALDTRIFTRIYADLAVPVILNQRLHKQSTSTAAARVVLAREFVDFFEKHVPAIATALVSIVGASVMLVLIERWIGLACLTALLLCAGLMPRFARRNQMLHQRLNDQLEKEIGLVQDVGAHTLTRHYRFLSRLRIGLSDREAIAFLCIGMLAATLFALAIIRLAMRDAASAGHIYAVMTYLWTFVCSLDEAPAMLDQLARLTDIGQRVHPGSPREVETQ